MKELIPTIESPDGLFHDGNPLTGELGTIVPAKWLNDMQGATQAAQSEILSMLATAGIEASAESSTQLLQALNKRYLQTDNSLSEFKEQNKVDDVLKNLGLKEAAKRAVGIGTNQIPDMSYWTLSPGWQRFPNGLIIQWGSIHTIAGDTTTLLSVTFPTAFLNVSATMDYTPGSGAVTYIAACPGSLSTIISRTASPGLGGRYIAIGY